MSLRCTHSTNYGPWVKGGAVCFSFALSKDLWVYRELSIMHAFIMDLPRGGCLRMSMITCISWVVLHEVYGRQLSFRQYSTNFWWFLPNIFRNTFLLCEACTNLNRAEQDFVAQFRNCYAVRTVGAELCFVFRSSISSGHYSLSPSLVVHNPPDTATDSVSRRQQRGREQALLEDPTKVKRRLPPLLLGKHFFILQLLKRGFIMLQQCLSV